MKMNFIIVFLKEALKTATRICNKKWEVPLKKILDFNDIFSKSIKITNFFPSWNHKIFV